MTAKPYVHGLYDLRSKAGAAAALDHMLSRQPMLKKKSYTAAERRELDDMQKTFTEIDQLRTHGGATRDNLRGSAADSGFDGPQGSATGKALSSAPSLRLSSTEVEVIRKSAQHRQGFRFGVGNQDELGVKSAVGNLPIPSGIQGQIIEYSHEPDRIMDHLPCKPLDTPSTTYLRHTSTTGSAGVVAEGGLKPTVVPVIETVTATARKIAALIGATDESLDDFAGFAMYLTNELTRSVVDVENDELLNGSGTGGHIKGLFDFAGDGAIVRDRDADTRVDAIEAAINDLRVGPAYATANLIIMHPTTWSKIRRSKDDQGRYIVAQDPTQAERNVLWGLPVVVTTVCPIDKAAVVDTTAIGNIFVRQGLVVDSNIAASDNFEHNVTTFRAEERLDLAVVKPAALAIVTGLTYDDDLLPLTWSLDFGGATSGSAKLTYRGRQTGTIAFNASNATVKTAIVGLDDGVDASQVTVTGSAGVYEITAPAGSFTVDGTSLAGGTGATLVRA